MNWINNITPENFEQSFNLTEILENSTFYPASGIDATDIEGLSAYTNSFVHVDYSVPENEVKIALNDDFKAVGYKLIGLKHISEKELSPNEFEPTNFHLKDSEKERLKFLEQAKNSQRPFCYWAIYEIDETLTGSTRGKLKKFSLLHIGAEAFATFDALYANNGTNPKAIAILNPREGNDDNWTKFTDPEYRLFNLIQVNSDKNNTSLPEYVFSNMVNDGGICFWPNYELIDKKTFLRPNSKWDECYTFRLK